jgi:hypothetical protein
MRPTPKKDSFFYFMANKNPSKQRLVIKEGERYGMLTVIGEGMKKITPSGQVNRQIHCKCDCGTEKDIILLHLVRNRISSCGCSVKTRNGEGASSLCKVWRQMKRRCSEKAGTKEKELYYNRGIRVCDEWIDDYSAFKEWAIQNGYKSKLTIDRINNYLGYTPDNCRLVTQKENANNKRNTIMITYKGETQSLQMLLAKLGLQKSSATYKQRINNGWNHDNVIDKPIKKKNYKTK